MQTAEILRHFVDVNEQEAALLTSAGGREAAAGIEDFTEANSVLICVQSGLVPAQFEARPPIQPRISHRLFSKIYREMTETSSKPTPRAGDILPVRNKQQLDRALHYIGRTLLPLSGVLSTSEPVQALLSARYIDACDRAEGFFADCLAALRGEKQDSQEIIKIFHDANGLPEFIQKFGEDSVESCLTLQPMTFTGTVWGTRFQPTNTVQVPAGSVAAVDKNIRKTKTGALKLGEVYVDTFRLDGPPIINPRRLTPWAYQQKADRALFAIAENGAPDKPHPVIAARRHAAEDISLKDFQYAAKAAIVSAKATYKVAA